MLDLGGALVARVITRRGPVVVVGGFEVVEAGCRFGLVTVFDGRSRNCEIAVDSWIAGSFLGRSCSSSPEFVAFRFKLGITGKDEDEEKGRVEDGNEIGDGPMFSFSWSVCSRGKRDILTFLRAFREKNHSLGRNRTAFARGHVTCICGHSRGTLTKPHILPGLQHHFNVQPENNVTLCYSGCQFDRPSATWQ